MEGWKGLAKFYEKQEERDEQYSRHYREVLLKLNNFYLEDPPKYNDTCGKLAQVLELIKVLKLLIGSKLAGNVYICSNLVMDEMLDCLSLMLPSGACVTGRPGQCCGHTTGIVCNVQLV